jgi:hypothetical protein
MASSLYAFGALLLGAQLMSIGFLAELITAYQSREEDSYSIADQVGPRSWEAGHPVSPADAPSDAL